MKRKSDKKRNTRFKDETMERFTMLLKGSEKKKLLARFEQINKIAELDINLQKFFMEWYLFWTEMPLELLITIMRTSKNLNISTSQFLIHSLIRKASSSSARIKSNLPGENLIEFFYENGKLVTGERLFDILENHFMLEIKEYRAKVETELLEARQRNGH